MTTATLRFQHTLSACLSAKLGNQPAAGQTRGVRLVDLTSLKALIEKGVQS